MWQESLAWHAHRAAGSSSRWDIENSTSRPDPVKAELRTMLYELFDAALRSAGITARRRDRFADRGDGLLALIDPADQALLIHVVIPVFSQLLASYDLSWATIEA
jgi:hypothetical protein